MCKLVLHPAPILEERLLLTTAQCRLFLALVILYEWQRLMCCLTCIASWGSLFFCSRFLRLSGRRKVISESIFSVRSLNLIRLQCRKAASNHSLAWTQWCERSVLPTSCLHTSICSDTGFTLSQRIRWSDGFSSATGSTGHVYCRHDEWSLLLWDFIVFCNITDTKTCAIS